MWVIVFSQAFNLTCNATESLDNMLTDSLKSRMPATSFQLFGVRQIEEDNMAACECTSNVLFYCVANSYSSAIPVWANMMKPQRLRAALRRQRTNERVWLLVVLQISVTRSFPRCSILLQSTAWRSWPPFSFSVLGLCRLTVWWTSMETTQTHWQRRVASLISDSSLMNLL